MAKTLFSVNAELKVEREKAIGIFNALIAILASKDVIDYDHFEVFAHYSTASLIKYTNRGMISRKIIQSLI